MISRLLLPDGRTVQLGERTEGGSKNHTRYGTLDDGQPVIVKIQATHGQLPREESALGFAADHGLPAPAVVSSGTTQEGSYFLVLTKEDGVRTNTPDGWQRMGRGYALLSTAPTADCPLPRISAQDFAADHRERLTMIKSLLTEQDHDRIAAAIDHFAGSGEPVLTHGDPGSGNYLDSLQGGTILDWETASIAPFGIDVGRAAFIAYLDNDHTGIPRQLHDAFIRGYRSALSDGSLSDDTLHSGTLIAALQFIHGRHTRPLRPDRTPAVAIDALAAYLNACQRFGRHDHHAADIRG
ncbi:MAG TPA: aminoglycoside phosphotransferase family protein [Microlunatus sp.]